MLDANNLNGIACAKCLNAGHRCPANTLDLDNEPVCVFCADGVACPTMKRAPSAPVAPAAEPTLRRRRGKLYERVKREPAASSVPENETTKEKNEVRAKPQIGPKLCNQCAKEYTPTGCRQVFCSVECKKEFKGGGVKKPKAAKATPRAPRVVKVARKAKGKTVSATEVVVATPAPMATPGVFTLAVREQHLDTFLLQLPPDRKYALVQAEIAAAFETPVEAVAR
jgi:hypothetical protein